MSYWLGVTIGIVTSRDIVTGHPCGHGMEAVMVFLSASERSLASNTSASCVGAVLGIG
jgi:hypothetical protein